MDRRQKKTRTAIFEAFTVLLSKKQYNKITIQEIIDEANVGRSTFYAHFETKEELLQIFCEDLFEHIIESTTEHSHTSGRYSNELAPQSAFRHILQHLQENDHNILNLLACESSEIFLKYFKESLNELIRDRIIGQESVRNSGVPEDFVVNHISGSFVEMLQWWSKNGKKQKLEELYFYFQRVLPPFVENC